MSTAPLPPGWTRPMSRPALCTCDMSIDNMPHQHYRQVDTYDATTTDRSDADDTTFAAELARIEAQPACDQDTVERVARALWLNPNGERAESYRRRLARAAIAALKPAPGADSSGQAVQRVLDLADDLDYYASKTTGGTAAYGYTEAAERIRAAVAGPQRDHEEGQR